MLQGLYSGALEDAAKRAELVSLRDLEHLAEERQPAINAIAAFAPRQAVHVLAEVKRASPSRGDLAEIADPIVLAKAYEAAGATAISVLTEERQFKGSLADLEAIRAEVALPLLRKDFIANEYQILEARASGADIFLLIVAGLDQATLIRLKAFGEQLGMTAFVETHDEHELFRALEADASLLGINARDLSTFETDRNLFGSLVHLVPQGVIKVAESAVRNFEDVLHYRQAGADVILVGEALVLGNPSELISEFLRI